MSVVHGFLLASAATTTFDVHRGAALPAARVVVIVIPLLALFAFWFLVVRPKRNQS